MDLETDVVDASSSVVDDTSVETAASFLRELLGWFSSFFNSLLSQLRKSEFLYLLFSPFVCL